VPVPQTSRRTQAERTAETRARILRAVVESIAEVGFQRTTASEITRRAGVSWGAVQHHFGGKDGILSAVLEDSFDRFAALLADVPRGEAPLEKRVGLFVDRAWAHFSSPDYHSTFEILLSYLPEESGSAEAGAAILQGEMFEAWNRVWSEIFSDVRLPRRRVAALQTFTISALSGMASLAMLQRAVETLQGDELALLKRTLLGEMGRA